MLISGGSRARTSSPYPWCSRCRRAVVTTVPPGRRPAGPAGAPMADGRRGDHARSQAGRAHQRIHRDGQVAALDHHSAAGRRLHHRDHRAAGAARRARRAADGDRLRPSAGDRGQPRVGARGARGRRAVGAAAGRAHEEAVRRRRGQPAGIRTGGDGRADHAGAAARPSRRRFASSRSSWRITA